MRSKIIPIYLKKRFTKETVSKLSIMRSVYRDYTKTPDKVYKPLGLTREIFYRYAKILDNRTNEEIVNVVY